MPEHFTPSRHGAPRWPPTAKSVLFLLVGAPPGPHVLGERFVHVLCAKLKPETVAKNCGDAP